MKETVKGIIGVGVIGLCAIGGILLKTKKFLSDERGRMSEEERKLMDIPIDQAEGIIRNMWNLGKKYMDEHPEEEYDWYFNN